MSYPGTGSRIRSSSIRVLLLASTALAFAGSAFAQESTAEGEPPEDSRDVVIVVGSQIVGAQPTDALPVTVTPVEPATEHGYAGHAREGLAFATRRAVDQVR